MDVHKDTIAAAAALAGREAPAYCGEIANRPSEIGKLAAKLAQRRATSVARRDPMMRSTSVDEEAGAC